jgi:general secretion pathway protein C
MQRSTTIRLATFVLWLLAAGSLAYWVLKFVRGPVAPATANVASLSAGGAAGAGGTGAPDSTALARGLGGGVVAPTGADNPAPAVSSINASRFTLSGVVVSPARQTSASVALIAVDGKPAKPYRVGTVLVDGVMLHSVAAGKAMLATSADAPVAVTLELPRLTSAVAGTAIAVRPVIPPQAVQAPTGAPVISAVPNATPAVGVTMPGVGDAGQSAAAQPGVTSTNPTAVPGQRPPRPSAMRGTERKREAQE